MDNIIIWFVNKIGEHRISAHAAHVAFFIMVSFFPFMMFGITIIRYTPLELNTLVSLIESIIPGSISSLVVGWLNETYKASSGTILSVTMITALWAGSKGFSGIVYGLDNIYSVEERRGPVKRRLLSLLYTVVFTVVIIFSLILLVYGNQIVQTINRFFPWLNQLKVIIFILRSCFSFLLFVFFFLCMYRFIPNHNSRLREELPGAGLCAFLWIAFSYLYSLYVDYNSGISSVYGSLTSIVLLMLWFYACIHIIFLGALLNQFLKEHKRLRILSSVKEIFDIVKSYLENRT